MVSFALALMVALRSKSVDGFEWRKIGELVLQHFKKRPREFFWPRSETVKYARITSDGRMIFEDGEQQRVLADNYVVRRLRNKSGEVIEVSVPADSEDTSEIREAIKAHHNDSEPNDAPKEHEQITAGVNPLPKPDKPPQLPK